MSKEVATAAYFIAIVALPATFLIIFMPSSAWPAIVGGAAALIIAFVAYPWQKSRDRELKIAEEKRSAYREFFSAAEEFNSLYSSSPGGEVDDAVRKAQSRLGASRAGLALLANPSGLKECGDLYAALLELKKISADFRRVLKRVQDDVMRDAQETNEEWQIRVLQEAVRTPEGKAWTGASKEISRYRAASVLAARNDCDLENHQADLESAMKPLFDFPRARRRETEKAEQAHT